MKFIVDAQLPKSLARLLRDLGHDAVHTLELPARNRTGDDEINKISIHEQRVIISKDSDFYDSYFGKKGPHKLLFLTCGNIRNTTCCNFSAAISLPSNWNCQKPMSWN